MMANIYSIDVLQEALKKAEYRITTFKNKTQIEMCKEEINDYKKSLNILDPERFLKVQ